MKLPTNFKFWSISTWYGSEKLDTQATWKSENDVLDYRSLSELSCGSVPICDGEL